MHIYMHPRLLSWTAFLDCSPGLLSWTPIFEIIGFWTGPGADIDVLRVWIICDGFSVFLCVSQCDDLGLWRGGKSPERKGRKLKLKGVNIY